MRICIISDVPWGYGSPQVGYLRDSLLSENLDIQYLVPNYPDRKVFTSDGVTQIFSEGNPFTREGMIAFGKRSADRISEFEPDKIIIVNPRSLVVLPFLKMSNTEFIYYGLEPILDHGLSFLKSLVMQKFKFSLGIFPNTERAFADADLLSIPASQVRILRNVPRLSSYVPTAQSKTAVTYAGALDWSWVNLNVLEKATRIVPLEIWGHPTETIPNSIAKSYRGNLPHSKVGVAYESSALSLVIWNPINFGTRNAAPNKFFEALSYGVPSVSFPFPQVVEHVTKYGIGFVSKDFSSESFLRALSHAYKMVPSNEFKEMQEQCLNLHKTQLNWETESHALVQEITSDNSK
jgi:hypothetical protein